MQHPISLWIEDTFGLKKMAGRWVRQQPRCIQSAAEELQGITGVAEETCAEVIQAWLLAGYDCEPNPETGQKPFAFRLHQFISPGDAAYATLEAEDERYTALRKQHYAPGQRDKLLFPLCFCRECGQEYYTVYKSDLEEAEGYRVVAREFRDQSSGDEGEAGYLYINSSDPWPQDTEALRHRLPDDWLEDRSGEIRIRSHRRRKLPRQLRLNTLGERDAEGLECFYVSSRFLFCLNCGVSYGPRQGDFSKLATLSSEGRSSATTLLSLSAVRSLKGSDLAREAQKLLSFTDNRQDASLQAGHFNDFIEVGLLRGAIYQAVKEAADEGLSHDVIALKVFDALNLPLELYAPNPEQRFQLDQTRRALRQVLGYRIYRDLRRGWRIALPNLEQCGLLRIDYDGLEAVCDAEDIWADCHPALVSATPQTRGQVARTLLDHLRRELAIKVDYLDPVYQERIQQLSSQHLIDPWAIDEDERMEGAKIALPRSSKSETGRDNFSFVSARGGYGMYLRRPRTFAAHKDKIGLDDTQDIICQLLERLHIGGLVEVARQAKSGSDVPGYQLKAAVMRWLTGDGKSYHDPLRMPNQPEAGGRPNLFFLDFYEKWATSLARYKAREHTAQVPSEEAGRARARISSGRIACSVLLADHGIRRGHRGAQCGQSAQCAADAGELCPTQRTSGPQRATGINLHLLRGAQST